MGFNFLQHDDFIAFGVDKFVLQETQLLAWNDSESESILHLPSEIEADETLRDEGFHVWIDIEFKLLLTKIVDNVVDFVFERVGEQDG